MNSSPEKIHNGMARQLRTWSETIAQQDQRLGWKIGFNMAADQKRLGLPSAMMGFLSAGHRLYSGDRYQVPAGAQLLVEPEVALLIGNDLPAGTTAAEAEAAIAAYCAALELVDTTRSVNDDMEAILAGNLFHDSVVLAEEQLPAAAFRREELALSLRINDKEVRTLDQPRVPEAFSTLILTVANTLAAHGERLQKGDWIITGAAAKPVPVAAGDVITLDMGPLGEIELTLA